VSGPLILGCDPGSRFCGLALVRGREVVAWDLVERTAGQSVVGWIGECSSGALLLACQTNVTGEAWQASPKLTVAVEDVNSPKLFINGKRQMISPESLIGTAAVMGGLVSWAATEGFPCLLVAPGGNGSGQREGYPAELWGAREGPAGTGRLGHVRSAWDIALAAQTMLRGIPA
jgi:hypothetical protein